jgi:hypothetical protein
MAASSRRRTRLDFWLWIFQSRESKTFTTSSGELRTGLGALVKEAIAPEADRNRLRRRCAAGVDERTTHMRRKR